MKNCNLKIRSQFWIPTVLLMILNSCSTNETELLDPSSFGYDYAPVALGKQWVYKTDSIVFRLKASIEIDTSVSYLMEQIVDTFRDSEHELIYRLDVFYSKDTLGSWEQINSNFMQKDELQFTKIENGLAYTKLIFPVRKNISWKGNNRIAPRTEWVIRGESLMPFSDEWDYSYDSVDQAETISGQSFSKVSTVTEVDDEHALEKRYSLMKYAKGTGLVYKEQWILDTQIFDTRIPFTQKAQKGMILRQTLISHN